MAHFAVIGLSLNLVLQYTVQLISYNNTAGTGIPQTGTKSGHHEDNMPLAYGH
jgi:hypothetical protein